MTAIGPIATFGSITAGSGYQNGTYTSISLTGGSGTNAFANITVSGGGVSSVSLINSRLDRTGNSYAVNDSLSANPSFDGVGSGIGFAVIVNSLAAACQNCFYGKFLPTSSGSSGYYCGNQAFLNACATQHSWSSVITPPDYWCGDGADLVTGNSFSSSITLFPASQGVIANTWNLYNPSIAPAVGAFTTVSSSGNYTTLGKLVLFSMKCSFTDIGTASGALLFSLPYTPVSLTPFTFVGRENTNGNECIGTINSLGGNQVSVVTYNNSSVIANSNVVWMSGTYRSV